MVVVRAAVQSVMRAIIFDFDGVIVDSEPMHEAALLAASRELGMGFTHAQYMTYIGLDDRETFERVARDNGRALAGEDLERLAAVKWEQVQVLIARGEAPSYPGVLELISTVAERCPLAICSGARRREVLAILKRLELARVFGVVVTADDVAKAKPDPALYRLAASRLAVAPQRCVAIEDTPRGMASAIQAGCRVVGVCHTLDRSALTEADLVVDRIGELTVERLLSVEPREL